MQSKIEAGARLRQGMALLAEGDYRQGWPLLEERFQIGRVGLNKPRLPFPEWEGQDVKGKVFVIWPEQGFGDQIQFARFAPVLRDRGAEVTLLCYPALERLFGTLSCINVVAAAGHVDFPDPDYWAMVGSLPRWLVQSDDDIPNGPYLKATPMALGDAKVGVVTNGSPAHGNDAHRSLDAQSAKHLMAQLGTRAMSLDPAQTGAKDFAETAQIVAGLDLVITVDTSVAHLAGALGKPCWVLLPAVETDWRWQKVRSDSPWYSSVRLFRQQAGQGWDTVISEILREIAGR